MTQFKDKCLEDNCTSTVLIDLGNSHSSAGTICSQNQVEVDGTIICHVGISMIVRNYDI